MRRRTSSRERRSRAVSPRRPRGDAVSMRRRTSPRERRSRRRFAETSPRPRGDAVSMRRRTSSRERRTSPRPAGTGTLPGERRSRGRDVMGGVPCGPDRPRKGRTARRVARPCAPPHPVSPPAETSPQGRGGHAASNVPAGASVLDAVSPKRPRGPAGTGRPCGVERRRRAAVLPKRPRGLPKRPRGDASRRPRTSPHARGDTPRRNVLLGGATRWRVLPPGPTALERDETARGVERAWCAAGAPGSPVL